MSDAKKAMAEIDSEFEAVPLMGRNSYAFVTREDGDVDVVVDVAEFNGKLHLSSIFTLNDARGKGKASEALKKLIAISEKHAVEIDLYPKPFGLDKGLGKAELVAWYKKYGFKKDKDGSGYVRKPTTKTEKKEPRVRIAESFSEFYKRGKNLNEIGDGRKSLERYDWKRYEGGSVICFFTQDEVNYGILIYRKKMGDKLYLGVTFGVVEEGKANELTNKGTPLSIMSIVANGVVDFVLRAMKGFWKDPQYDGICFTAKKEHAEDDRREHMYMRYTESLMKKIGKEINVWFKPPHFRMSELSPRIPLIVKFVVYDFVEPLKSSEYEEEFVSSKKKEKLEEIGGAPVRATDYAWGWSADGKDMIANFTLKGVEFYIVIGRVPYDGEKYMTIDYGVTEADEGDYAKMTKLNVPLQTMSMVSGAIVDFFKTQQYKKIFSGEFVGLMITAKKEYEGDTRRHDMYLRYAASMKKVMKDEVGIDVKSMKVIEGKFREGDGEKDKWIVIKFAEKIFGRPLPRTNLKPHLKKP